MLIHDHRQPFFLVTKKKLAPRGEVEGRMNPDTRELEMYSFIASLLEPIA